MRGSEGTFSATDHPTHSEKTGRRKAFIFMVRGYGMGMVTKVDKVKNVRGRIVEQSTES